jgi:multidrug efflux pump subunit AcrB
VSVTRFAIEKDRITIVALIIIIAAGYIAYTNMPRNEDPGFTIRTAVVTTAFPGASPERVEQLVTDRLEKAIQEMPEIDFISSESKTGLSIIYVNIQERYTKMRPIWDDLRRKVERAAPDLPREIIGPIVDDEFGDVFGIVIAITGEGYSYSELKEIADDCRNELLLIDEAAKVEIYGAQDERIFVEYNNARLAEANLSPGQLKQIIEQRNIIIPGGKVYTRDEQIVLEPTGNVLSVEDLRRTVIQIPGSTELVYLQDIASVYRGYVDPSETKIRCNGQPCLVLAVNLREGGNIIELGEKVKEQVNRFKTGYPIGVDFDFVYFLPRNVDKRIDEFLMSLLQAVCLVMLVMLVALGIRTGLVVATLIPMAMIMGIFLMRIFDIGLDMVSLASLIIALGLLVDNAIVMSESIMVQMRDGKPRIEAAVDSARELQVPLLTSSLTTAAAFLPIFLAESMVGEYTASIFKVVTITLLSSWVLALTMTPTLCVKFLKVKKGEIGKSYDTRFYKKYRNFLIMMLRHPVISLVVVLIVFVSGMMGFGLVPNIFFPENDKPTFYSEIKFPIGTPLSKTDAAVKDVEAFMAREFMGDTLTKKEGIINWASFIGVGPPRYELGINPEPVGARYAYILLNGTSLEVIKNVIVPQLDSFYIENYPDVTFRNSLMDMGPPVKYPVEVRIYGKDQDQLFAMAEEVKGELSSTSGVTEISDNWGTRAKKIMVNVNEARARRAGLTNYDVAVSLQAVLSGIESSNYYEEDKVIPITLRSVAAERNDVGKLESHNIFSSSTGRSVPLKQVADIEVVWESSSIVRRDRLRQISVRAMLDENTNAIALSQQMEQWMNKFSNEWPIGYSYEIGGEMETSGEANQSIADKLPVAGLIIVLLLVTQFNSIRKPAIILLTIPLGLIGVVIGLIVAQSYFGFMTLLGVVSLAGIVINNAIVLLERIKIEIEQNGFEPRRAIVEAAQRRMRPILLTTMTTMLGLLPLWFGGSSMFKPMAIAIIFGLLFATTLTLGVVPVLYSVLFRIKFKGYTYSK